jgi:hypothetical protein
MEKSTVSAGKQPPQQQEQRATGAASGKAAPAAAAPPLAAQTNPADAFMRIELEGDRGQSPLPNTEDRGSRVLQHAGDNQPAEHDPMAVWSGGQSGGPGEGPLGTAAKTATKTAPQAAAQQQSAQQQRAPAPGLVSHLAGFHAEQAQQRPQEQQQAQAQAQPQRGQERPLAPLASDRMIERILPKSEGLLDHSEHLLPVYGSPITPSAETGVEGARSETAGRVSAPAAVPAPLRMRSSDDDLVDGPDWFHEPEPSHIAGEAWDRAEASMRREQQRGAGRGGPGQPLASTSSPWLSSSYAPNTPPLPMLGPHSMLAPQRASPVQQPMSSPDLTRGLGVLDGQGQGQGHAPPQRQQHQQQPSSKAVLSQPSPRPQHAAADAGLGAMLSHAQLIEAGSEDTAGMGREAGAPSLLAAQGDPFLREASATTAATGHVRDPASTKIGYHVPPSSSLGTQGAAPVFSAASVTLGGQGPGTAPAAGHAPRQTIGRGIMPASAHATHGDPLFAAASKSWHTDAASAWNAGTGVSGSAGSRGDSGSGGAALDSTDAEHGYAGLRLHDYAVAPSADATHGDPLASSATLARTLFAPSFDPRVTTATAPQGIERGGGVVTPPIYGPLLQREGVSTSAAQGAAPASTKQQAQGSGLGLVDADFPTESSALADRRAAGNQQQQQQQQQLTGTAAPDVAARYVRAHSHSEGQVGAVSSTATDVSVPRSSALAAAPAPQDASAQAQRPSPSLSSLPSLPQPRGLPPAPPATASSTSESRTQSQEQQQRSHGRRGSRVMPDMHLAASSTADEEAEEAMPDSSPTA